MFKGSNTGRDKKSFSSLKAQTGYGAHTESYSMDTGVLSLGLNGWGVKLTTHFHLVPRLKKE
jgi:hypothetical protein